MHSSGPSNSNAMNEAGSQQYNPQPISNFVSIKLCGETNYNPWMKQMMCLLEYHDMVGFIDGTIRNPYDDITTTTVPNPDITTTTVPNPDIPTTVVPNPGFISLVRPGLFRNRVRGRNRLSWGRDSDSNSNGDSDSDWDGDNDDIGVGDGDCDGDNDDVGDGDGDGDGHNIGDYGDYEWNKSKDTLVKGWIFSTLSEDVLDIVLDLKNAYRVWKKLKDEYHNSPRVRVKGAKFYTMKVISSLEEADEANYIPLERAIERGEWDKAPEFFSQDNALLTAKINLQRETPLHVAICRCKNFEFVSNLINKIEERASLLTLVGYRGNTPLYQAAVVGNMEAAMMLVEKDPCLLFIVNEDDQLPIHRAILNYHHKTFLYLLQASRIAIRLSENHGCQNPFRDKQGTRLLRLAISRGYLDVAYELLLVYPNMAISKNENATPLQSIAKNEDVYFSATTYNFYQRFIYSHVPIEDNIPGNDIVILDIENPENYSTHFLTKSKIRNCFYPEVQHIKRLQEDKLKHKKALMILERICEEIATINKTVDIYYQYCGAFNMAVLKDNHEAVETITRFFPHAIWSAYHNNYVPQTVAKYRCEMVLNFLVDLKCEGYDVFSRMPRDNDGNTILHLAGLLAPIEKLNVVSGAALQMQKEVRWFKRIEKFVLPCDMKKRNKNGQTPIMVFREEHKNLRKEGEEWMKKTSDSYTITTALIITIVFAAAITVPGGLDQSTGKPLYTKNLSFTIFAISDAISLFTSTTSLLLFLSILTARYHEDDFLYKLPKRLILGLVMLFLSVTSMMVAFGATLYILFGQGEWILIPIVALACLPIASYVILQYPLLHELVSSTYGQRIYIKRNDLKNK